MYRTHLATALLIFLSLAACSASNGPSEPVAESASPTVSESAPNVSESPTAEQETARLNAWFEDQYQAAISRSPMRATFLGSRENYDKWDDVSPKANAIEMEILRQGVAYMRYSFDPETLDPQGQLSFRLAEYQLEQAERAYKWRTHGYTFNQMFGAHSRIPAFLIAQHKVIDKSDAEAYISRLVGIETYLGQHMANAASSAEQGIRPPLFVYDYILSDAQNIISGYPFGEASPETPSPLYADISGKLKSLQSQNKITEDEASKLKAAAVEALTEHVYPTYSLLISYLENDKKSATADDGAWKLPNGQAYYEDRLALMTTTQMSAAEIHQLGLDEVARIHDEMRAIMTEVGFEGSLQDFFEFTRTDSQFFNPNTAEGKAAYLSEATAMIDTMRGALPSVFNTFPKAELDVRAVEAFREKSAGKAFYSRPAPDGSRPGIYYANLYDMNSMPLYQMEALAYHEGIPGHHMQLAISQELTGLPKFRKYGGYTAYTEGWGLYSELLPKEMGFYTDPMSDYGRLAMELWRAARLVVDTGLHELQWTREEAIEYLLTQTPNPEADCVKAIERYIVMPGQATAYKIGMNKIVALREDAKARLGEAFDIRSFHDVILKDGPVPLAILEETVEAWVTDQL